MEMYMVGGFVRDTILGRASKDVDFSCVANSFEDMQSSLEAQGFTVFVSSPEFYTLRARGPKDFTFDGRDFGNMTFDFVWARKDGPYTDGRRPDYVVAGSLMDDLSRRDFSMNAMAVDERGILHDPFDGLDAIRGRRITAVGNPVDRFTEDSLRILRAMRFSVVLGFDMDDALVHAAEQCYPLLMNVSKERVNDELSKMFAHSTSSALYILYFEMPKVGRFLLDHMDVRLMPTLKEK